MYIFSVMSFPSCTYMKLKIPCVIIGLQEDENGGWWVETRYFLEGNILKWLRSSAKST